jgi:hypothetical protein
MVQINYEKQNTNLREEELLTHPERALLPIVKVYFERR